MLKNPTREFRIFIERFLAASTVPALSLFTLFEIRQSPRLFDKFLEYFAMLPSVILKSHEQLFEEEFACYPNQPTINPVLLAPMAITPPQGQQTRQAPETCFAADFFRERERYWNASKAEIVEGINSLVPHFPPRAGKYDRSMIREFVETNVLQQTAFRRRDDLRAMVGEAATFDPSPFRSLKMMAYTVFFKFCPDRRKCSDSDAFDIIIAAPVP